MKRKYPHYIVDKGPIYNRRRNPMMCKHPGCEERSTHTITMQRSWFRGDDECFPACTHHAKEVCVAWVLGLLEVE